MKRQLVRRHGFPNECTQMTSVSIIRMLFPRWYSSGHRAASFHVILTLLLYLSLMAKQSEGQLPRVYIYPNADDQVIEVGTTLNLTCTCSENNYRDYRSNITWILPDLLVKYKIIRNSITHYNFLLWVFH